MNNQTITKLILAVLICLLADMFCFPATLAAQKILDPIENPKLYKTEIIHADQGLSAPLLQCIYEDQYGFIWIGTQYGLDRYDGYSVTRMSDIVSDSVNTSMEWIWSIQEDLEGTLWVCSSKGLFRYDRTINSFEILLPNRVEPSSEDNEVYSIKQDSRSIYWLFTKGGLFSYDRNTNSFKDYKKDSIETREIGWGWDYINFWNQIRFCEDQSGTVWIGSFDGLKKYDHQNDRFITFRHDPDDPQSISGNFIHCITEDKFGNLWISAQSPLNQRDELDKMINKDKGVFKRYYHDEANPSSLVSRDWIWPILSTKDSNLWIGGSDGFSKYNYETDDFDNYRLPIISLRSSGRIPHITEDSKGNLWMIWFVRGLVSFNPSTESIYHYYYDPGSPDILVPDNRISTILEDRSGSIWVSGQERIIRSDPLFKDFHSTTPEKLGLNPERDMLIFAIHFDNKGALWFGGDFGLIKSPDFVPGNQNEFKQITDYWPYCFLRDHSGQLWIGTNSWGLGKINEQTNAIKWYRWHQDHPDSLSNDYITMMYEDKRKLIWLSPFYRGLNIFHPDQERFISIGHDPEDPDGLVSQNINSINEDQHGNMWFGSFGEGLSKLEVSQGLADSIGAVFAGEFEQDRLNFRFRNFSNNHFDPYSLSSNLIFDMYTDASGRLWIGTTNGLNLYNETDENFFVFTEAVGLPDNCIFGILEDDHGNLWLSTRKGICKVVLKDGTGPDLIISVQSYRKDDGLQGDIFYENTCHKTEDGWMAFGGNHGFTVFHPDSIKNNYMIPPVYITDMHINNESVYSPEYSVLETGLFDTDEVELPYKQNFLAFEYLALNYSNAEQNQYKYMMDGLDEDWVEAGNRRYAEYRDLKPGSYTFRVIGSNDDGIWNEEGASIGIAINPPWYRTILAYFMYVIALVLLVFGYVRRRTYLLKKENERLDNLVKVRTKEVEEQKEEIMATNSELEEQKEEIMATNTELNEQKEEIMTINTQLEEQKEELEQQKEELQITLDQLKETQAQLIQSEKLAALGGLVAGVAHEINTPVGISVTAASSLMEESMKMAEKYKENKISRAEFKDYLNDANQSAKLILSNMERTAEMVQSFKQVSADQSTSQKRNFLLKSYTQDVIRSLYPKLKKRKIKIHLDMDEKIELDSYPGAFSQIITNLVLNSLIHGFDQDEQGSIDITAEIGNGQLKIKYKDNGKGIKTETLKHIFEPFYTTNKKIGTGLGLHIVYNLVTQKLNGTINCDSEPGKGVEFNIRIPVA